MANRPRFWAPESHADRRPFLIARGEIVRALRDLFAVLEFVEVETAILQVSPGNETHVHAMRTELASPTGRDRRFMRASPEFACKKLSAAGERRIFEFARCFRNRESGPLHHPEFTMLEWYRAHGQYELLMDDCMAVLACAAQTTGTRQFQLPRPHRQPVRRARADHGGRSLRPICRHRPAVGAAARGARPPALRHHGARRRRERHPGGHLGRRLQPGAGGEDRAESRQRPRHHPRTNIRA